MCRWLAVLLTLTVAALGGCVSGNKDRSTARSSGPPMTGVVGDDVIYVDVAVIERTFGDAFLNQELWTEADEEIVYVEGEPAVSLERRRALEKNGFRVGQVGGLLPSKLQDLLTSQRSCQARRTQLHAGHETVLSCGPPWPQCRYRLVHDDRSATVEMDQAQCELKVVPSLADEGHIRLRFTPLLKHGETKTAFVPVHDADGQFHWGRAENQTEEEYPWLDWTLTVVPNEYVVVGAYVDKGDTLGEQFFLTREEGHPWIQRLLVLRATHMPTPANENVGRCPPLALRASLLTVRGRSE
ncbi:MAG TPA: hypothetical protein VMF69_28210 [Gemmataceae bacterium]|nr:hypothetical protein [Gemmataceae bacterium]